MRYDKLIIMGKAYGIEDIHTLPTDVIPLRQYQKSDEKVIVFFGHKSPFSNFYTAPFNHNEHHFKTSEHAIQFTKANIFDDYHRAQQILNCDSAREAKQLGKKIKNFQPAKWRQEGPLACYDLIKAKFQQDINAREALINTGNKVIAETSSDTLWGTGIPLNSPDALVEDTWENRGWMHKILTRIRTELTTSQ